jgi:hypothetical protein
MTIARINAFQVKKKTAASAARCSPIMTEVTPQLTGEENVLSRTNIDGLLMGIY